MKKVEMYTVNYCPYCKRAKQILERMGIPFKEIDITANEEEYREELGRFYNIEGDVTVPQIIIDGKLIGGLDNLEELIKDGKLEELLKDD